MVATAGMGRDIFLFRRTPQMTLLSLQQLKGPRRVLPLGDNLEPQARSAEDPSMAISSERH